jgi:hypothetical protein
MRLFPGIPSNYWTFQEKSWTLLSCSTQRFFQASGTDKPMAHTDVNKMYPLTAYAGKDLRCPAYISGTSVKCYPHKLKFMIAVTWFAVVLRKNLIVYCSMYWRWLFFKFKCICNMHLILMCVCVGGGTCICACMSLRCKDYSITCPQASPYN